MCDPAKEVENAGKTVSKWGEDFDHAVGVSAVSREATNAAKAIGSTVEAIAQDPRKLAAVGIMIAFPAAASTVGGYLLPASVAASYPTMAAIVGQTAINAATNGGDVKQAVTSALIAQGAPELTKYVANSYATEGVSEAITNWAAKATVDTSIAAALGKDPGAALLFGGVKAATSAVLDQTDIKSALNYLPKEASSALKAAITAKVMGIDPSKAVAQDLVNQAIGAAKGMAQAQNYAIYNKLPKFTEEELGRMDPDVLTNSNGIQNFVKDTTAQREGWDGIWEKTLAAREGVTDPTEYKNSRSLGTGEFAPGVQGTIYSDGKFTPFGESKRRLPTAEEAKAMETFFNATHQDMPKALKELLPKDQEPEETEKPVGGLPVEDKKPDAAEPGGGLPVQTTLTREEQPATTGTDTTTVTGTGTGTEETATVGIGAGTGTDATQTKLDWERVGATNSTDYANKLYDEEQRKLVGATSDADYETKKRRVYGDLFGTGEQAVLYMDGRVKDSNDAAPREATAEEAAFINRTFPGAVPAKETTVVDDLTNAGLHDDFDTADLTKVVGGTDTTTTKLAEDQRLTQAVEKGKTGDLLGQLNLQRDIVGLPRFNTLEDYYKERDAEDGDDTLTGGTGDDTLTGGTGTDATQTKPAEDQRLSQAIEKAKAGDLLGEINLLRGIVGYEPFATLEEYYASKNAEDGDDTTTGGTGTDTTAGSTGTDTVAGGDPFAYYDSESKQYKYGANHGDFDPFHFGLSEEQFLSSGDPWAVYDPDTGQYQYSIGDPDFDPYTYDLVDNDPTNDYKFKLPGLPGSKKPVFKPRPKAKTDTTTTTTKTTGTDTTKTTGTDTTKTTGTDTTKTTAATAPQDNMALFALLASMGNQQAPAPAPVIDSTPSEPFDFTSEFDVDRHAKNKFASKMAQGGSIDELLDILRRN